MNLFSFNRLGFFERKGQFYNQPQLVMEIAKHYTNQGIKQLYVLVLGLDVIGNPFGFVRGVSTGVKDFFYEPYQVSIALNIPFVKADFCGRDLSGVCQ